MKRNKLSCESIAFQKGAFFNELSEQCVALIEELNKKGNGKSIEESTTIMEKLIFNYTKLNFTLDIGERDFSVEIPRVDKNNILIRHEWKKFFDNKDFNRAIKASKEEIFRGHISLKHAKASGIFSEIHHVIYLHKVSVANKKFTGSELAAIILHEIGHVFTYYEYITRTITTNQILSAMTDSLTKANSHEDRAIILMTVKKSLYLKDLEVEKLSKVDNAKVVETVIVSNIIDETRSASDLGNNIYDLNSWEALADQFAVRHGAGMNIVTALDKIYRESGNISYRSTTKYVAIEAMKVVLTILSPLFALLLVSIDSPSDIYDTPEARFKRVRNDIISNLKQKNLSKDTIDNLNEQVNTIDAILENIEDRRQLYEVIWEFVSPGARRDRNYINLQKKLEEVASNDLHRKGLLLNQLGD